MVRFLVFSFFYCLHFFSSSDAPASAPPRLRSSALLSGGRARGSTEAHLTAGHLLLHSLPEHRLWGRQCTAGHLFIRGKCCGVNIRHCVFCWTKKFLFFCRMIASTEREALWAAVPTVLLPAVLFSSPVAALLISTPASSSTGTTPASRMTLTPARWPLRSCPTSARFDLILMR